MQDYRYIRTCCATGRSGRHFLVDEVVQDYRLHQDMLATITKLSGLTTTQLSGATESVTA
jgi:hypothetical protein